MDRIPALRSFDPVNTDAVDRIADNSAFDALFDAIVATTPSSPSTASEDAELWFHPFTAPVTHHRVVHRFRLAGAAALVVFVLAGSITFAVTSTGPLKGPITTSWRASQPFPRVPHAAKSQLRSGIWRLVDQLLGGAWQQNTAGPPPGTLSCPSASTCYVMSGDYASANAGAPLLAESLYVSDDRGATWASLPTPSGFASRGPLSCADDLDCASGGTYHGQPVLLTTSDGGHTFTIHPYPSSDGELYSLTCPTADTCAGLAATSVTGPDESPVDATLLRTTDGGASFTNAPVEAGESMLTLTCPTALDCVTVGRADADANDFTAGVTATTTDGAEQWTSGQLPAGFGVFNPHLSCSDSLHCMVTGLIEITVANPPECAEQGDSPPTTTPMVSTTTIAPSAAVQAIAGIESAAAIQANAARAANSAFSCNPRGQRLVSDVASTSDGGLSWTPDALPADVPSPQLSDVACASASECWVTGSEEVFQRIGGASDADSSMLLGTTDGGATWSRVSFSVPSTAPNSYGQSYLSIGSISCPSASVCVALGETAQSSPTAPVYSLESPGSS